MVPERDRWGEYKSCALGCGYVSYPEPLDYTPVANRGRRKEERLIGRPKRPDGRASAREPYRKQRNSARGVLGSRK